MTVSAPERPPSANSSATKSMLEMSSCFVEVAAAPGSPSHAIENAGRDSARLAAPAYVRMQTYHLAQVNIARMRGALSSSVMAGFVARLDELNALADRSPGFVWRLQTDGGNATYLQPYDDNRIIINLSVWESVEALRQYVYRSAHRDALRQRAEWFEHVESAYIALWWIPAGHAPSVDEAKRRLEHLQTHGPSQFAFGFKSIVAPDDEYLTAFDWSVFKPCVA